MPEPVIVPPVKPSPVATLVTPELVTYLPSKSTVKDDNPPFLVAVKTPLLVLKLNPVT